MSVGPQSGNWCPYKGREIWRERHGEKGHVMRETGPAFIMPQAKEHQGLLATARS